MPNVDPIDLHTNYASENKRASSLRVDADHAAIENWINVGLVPALRKIIRDDGTLASSIVRLRNLHPEVTAMLGGGGGGGGGGTGGGSYGISVTDHGATGDGIADDTAAFIAAITAAAGGPVYVPAGNYAVALQLTDEPLHIVGSGTLLQRQGQPALRVTRPLGPPRSCSVSYATIGPVMSTAQPPQVISSTVSTAADISDIANGDRLFITSQDYYAFDAFQNGTKTYKASWGTVHGVCINVGSPVNGGVLEDDAVTGSTSGAFGIAMSAADQGDGTCRVIFSKMPTPFVAGETLTVNGQARGTVSGSPFIVLFDKLTDTFTTAPVFYKIDKIPLKIDGISFAADGDINQLVGAANRVPAVELYRVQDAIIRCEVKSAWGAGISLLVCYGNDLDVRADNLPNNHTDGAWGYGVSVYGATERTTVRVIASRCRHAFTTLCNANSSFAYANMNLIGTPKHNTVRDSIASACYAAGFDTHPGAYFTTFLNCVTENAYSGRRELSVSPGFQNRAFGTRFINCLARNCLHGFIENSGIYGTGDFPYINNYDKCTSEGHLNNGFVREDIGYTNGDVLYESCISDGRWGSLLSADTMYPNIHLQYNYLVKAGGVARFSRCVSIGAKNYNWCVSNVNAKIDMVDCFIDLSYSYGLANSQSGILFFAAPIRLVVSGLTIRTHPYSVGSLLAVFRIATDSHCPIVMDEVRFLGSGPRPMWVATGGATGSAVITKSCRSYTPRLTIVSSEGTSNLGYGDTVVSVSGTNAHTINLPKAYESQNPVTILNGSTQPVTVSAKVGSGDTVSISTIAAGGWCEYLPGSSEWSGKSSSGYSLPTASAGTLGGVKVGANLSIDGSGVLSASSSGSGSGIGSLYDWNDFLGGSNASGITSTIYTFTASGGGLSYNSVGHLAGVQGVAIVSTGMGTTGYGVLSSGLSSIDLGEGAIEYNIRINVPTVSDGTDTFAVRVGISDSSGGADPVDGAYFRYTHSANGGRWECVTRSNSVEIATDSGLSTGVGSTSFVKLRILTDPVVGNVKFYVNNLLVQTHTTNIPTGSARGTGLVPAGILKSAGTTSRAMYVDYAEFKMTLTAAR